MRDQSANDWRNHVVVENHLTQTGEVDGFRPTMAGRMVRSERYKYCVFSRGTQRESLVDMQADPGETIDLATDPKYREILLQHRALLARFGQEHRDPLVAELLADQVKPLPFRSTSRGGPAPPRPAQ
jgi:arylsulfatase A-like enzyme